MSKEFTAIQSDVIANSIYFERKSVKKFIGNTPAWDNFEEYEMVGLLSSLFECSSEEIIQEYKNRL